MAGINIRVSSQTHQALRELSSQEGETISRVLGKAVDSYWKQRILEETNQAFARLKANTKAWEIEKDERKLWENTLNDGDKSK